MHKIKRNEIKYNVLKVFLENVEKKRRKKKSPWLCFTEEFLNQDSHASACDLHQGYWEYWDMTGHILVGSLCTHGCRLRWNCTLHVVNLRFYGYAFLNPAQDNEPNMFVSTARLAPAMGNAWNFDCQIECDELDSDFNSPCWATR